MGGGPSLKRFDWDILKAAHDRDEKIIVINQAFKQAPYADIWFSEDIRVVELNHATPEWKSFQGVKILHALASAFENTARELDPTIEFLDCGKREDKFWSRSLSEGLSKSSNSGVGAINLAQILGADPIMLLGFDCRSGGPATENYHSDYPPGWATGSTQYDSFKSDFENWVAPHVLDMRVINMVDPDFESALTCWQKTTFQLFCQPDPVVPLVISFFTSDYDGYACDLENSLQGNVTYALTRREQSTWQAMVCDKPRFVLSEINRVGRGVLWTDADSILCRPVPWNELVGCDVAFHYFKRNPSWPDWDAEILTGTFYIFDSAAALNMMEDWVATVPKYRGVMCPEQVALKETLGRHPSLKIKKLGPEWCFIHDDSRALYPDVKPIFEHFQASRGKKRV